VPDIVFAERSASSRGVRVAAGAGDGSFVLPAATFPTGSQPFTVARGDLDGDGVLDVASVDLFDGAYALRGLPVGGFEAAALKLGGLGMTSLALRDLDRDGRLDIVASFQQQQKIGVARATGPLAFEAPRDLAASSWPGRPVAADITGDGIEDVSVPMLLSSNGLLLRGREGAGFDATPQVFTIGGNPSFALAADLSGKGRTDLAAFTTRDTATGQLDRDLRIERSAGPERLDLVATANAGTAPPGMAAGDVTGDEVPDLVVGGSSLVVLRGAGDGRFAPTATSVRADAFAMAVADVDGDGRNEAVIASFGLGQGIIARQGPAGFEEAARFDCGPSPVVMALADFDGDGRLDVATVNQLPHPSFPQFGSDGRVTVALAGADAGFQAAPVTFSTAPNPIAIAAADLDLDGPPDLVVLSFVANANEGRVFRGRGDGSFEPAGSIPLGNLPNIVVARDFTGDGVPDLANFSDVMFSGAARVQLYRGRGDLSFDVVYTSTPLDASGGYLNAAIPCDLAGSGRLDLVVQGFSAHAVGILRNVGPARGFFARNTQRLATVTRGGPFARLDACADGVPDFANLNGISGDVEVLAGTRGGPTRALDLGGRAAPPGVAARDLRACLVEPLDPRLGEPGLVATPTAGARLMPASAALAVYPDTAALGADLEVSLDLDASVLGAEVAGPIHVYRHESDVPGARRLPYRPRLAGRIVEAASTAGVAAPPPGARLATVDASARRISFPVRRLGVFQAFVEVPTAAAIIFRETFDDPDVVASPVHEPPGWVLPGFTWSVGCAVTTTGLPGAPAAAASAPLLLGTNRRGDRWRANAGAGDAATSPRIALTAAVPSGKRVALRFRELRRLGTDGAATPDVARIVRVDSSGGTEEVASFSAASSAGAGFVASGPYDVPVPAGPDRSFRLRFEVTGGAADHERAWLIDDIEVAVEPAP
jgi:hypothetical protein